MKLYVLIIYIFILSLLSFGKTKVSELIVQPKGKVLVLRKINGEVLGKIEIPNKISSGFKIKGKYICYAGEDNRINWYNWSSNKKFSVPKGPYLYKDKKFYGPEVYKNFHFDNKSKKIVFSIVPEYIIDGNKIQRNYNMAESLEIGLIDLNKKKFFNYSDKDHFGYKQKPFIFENNKLIFLETISIVVFDIKNNMRVDLLEKYKNFFNIKGLYAYLNLITIKNGSIFIAEYDKLYNKIIKISSYNLSTGLFKELYKKENISINFSFDSQELMDISKNNNYLLFLKDKKKIYTYNLNDKKLNLILKSDLVMPNIQFCVFTKDEMKLILNH